ncbi:MAG: NFACT family protein, partial [Myxococcota bacterium]
MNLTSEDIYRITKDLNRNLIGGKIQGIYQPLREELYLEIFVRQKSVFLLISIENGLNRIYITDSKPENPAIPFSFQMLLRKYLLPSYINEIVQLNNDRVVKISLLEFNIYAELTGRHANIFLTDSSDIILGSMRENLSQKRPLFPSYKYILPFSKDRMEISSHNIPEGVDIQRYYSLYYERLIREQRLIRLREEIIRGLNKEFSRLQGIAKKIVEDKKRAMRYEEYLKYAEALKQNRILERGDDYILCEYYTESGIASINVPKIEGRNTFEMMEYYFKLYKRYKNAIHLILEREREIGERINALKNKIDEVNNANDLESLRILRSNIIANEVQKIGH